MNYTFEELQEKIKFMVEQLPLTVESMNKMKSTQLNENQAKELAKRSISTRFEDVDVDSLNINLDDLLKPIRPEDKSNDLFTVFNRIQEKILNGDFMYISGVKVRKARKVKNFQQDIKINAKLYEIASEFVGA
jgi:nitrous oxide reductase